METVNMKRLLLQLAAACCLVAVASADQPSIGVYVDSLGSTCNGSTTAGVLVGSVWANLNGPAGGGITSAEFRIDLTDRVSGAWGAFTMTWSPDPNAVASLGNPDGQFNHGGVNIAYGDCQTGTRVKLFSFMAIENTPSTDEWLSVHTSYHPTNPNFLCPLFTLCDAPAYTKICAGPAEDAPVDQYFRSVINPSIGVSSDCPAVGVTPTSWSTIKNLYR
jgi:hypothetical protein